MAASIGSKIDFRDGAELAISVLSLAISGIRLAFNVENADKVEEVVDMSCSIAVDCIVLNGASTNGCCYHSMQLIYYVMVVSGIFRTLSPPPKQKLGFNHM